MDYQLKGKLAFVTAGAHGIGEAIANLLTQEGAFVIVADQDASALQEKASRWGGIFSGDLTSARVMEQAIAHVLSAFGKAPDILINNLGVGDSSQFENISDERWVRTFEINLMGTIRTCRALLPKMRERGSGSIINIGSDLAKQPEPSLMDYGVCKSGLLYLTKALAKQYAPTVRVNSVLPGPIWTRMWSRPGGLADQIETAYGLNREAALKRFLEDRQLPMGIGKPEDVAHAVVFLASPLAKFITGAAVDIGGTIRGLI